MPDQPDRRAQVPCHVWARLDPDSDWAPALLLRWHRQDDGTWAGEVAMVLGATGLPGVALVPAPRLRPVD